MMFCCLFFCDQCPLIGGALLVLSVRVLDRAARHASAQVASGPAAGGSAGSELERSIRALGSLERRVYLRLLSRTE